MFDREDSELGVVIGVLFGVIALVIALTIGMGSYALKRTDNLYVKLEPVGEALSGIMFGDGDVEFPMEAAGAFAGIIEELEENPASIVLISGFLDNEGGAKAARERSLSIKKALASQGIEPERILVRKPVPSPQHYSVDEGRRIEIRVQ